MIDILANSDFGRDDGIMCRCGNRTYVVDNKSGGFLDYKCNECGESFKLQYDGYAEHEEEYDEEDFLISDYEKESKT